MNATRKTNKTNSDASKLIGEICLYGNYDIGYGWLARDLVGGLYGNGEPIANRRANDAVWLACLALTDAGFKTGMVRIFMAGGERMADTRVDRPCYYGDLKWRPATVIEISAEAIMATAEAN